MSKVIFASLFSFSACIIFCKGSIILLQIWLTCCIDSLTFLSVSKTFAAALAIREIANVAIPITGICELSAVSCNISTVPTTALAPLIIFKMNGSFITAL